ncbi:aminopeptidase N [Protopterus annectens]|uniref:aminopeptidase N n=1 Tax=Protopterus annectens TaxID=7888 RepID=UPI001CFA13CB|nr:aminopeptidase N [Protopterus annectens]XP_043934236.1 aminopeptidase N [Protopterus annectens]XP_043934237.1 aminopeptidase N [Protopterus annectens]
MGKGFYISKTLAVFGIVLSAAAVATIIALAVVYSQELGKNVNNEAKPTEHPETKPPSVTETSTTKEPTTSPLPTNPWDKIRLPTTLVPEHYDIRLQPHLEPNGNNMYIFEGSSSVYFICAEETDLILIHSRKLNYTMQAGFHASLTSDDPSVTVPRITNTTLQIKNDYLIVQLDQKLVKDKTYKLLTNFIGELADDLAGFYRSEYIEDGAKRIIATTQMQSTDARKAFPCFDEPALKATFNITIVHKPEFIALSNQPVLNEETIDISGETWSVTEFEKTLKMSTYLLAFIVGDFDYVNNTIDGVLIRIWARRNAIKAGQGNYSLEVTGPILKHFEKYYNTTYPLKKSDQIALPDFAAGAMENWGLITYRETALLYDPLTSSTGNKERVVTVIAHELAHQWFGNLVTIRWWNDLWLNEGFASYVEYLGAHEAEPTWNITDLIVQYDVYRAMGVDALTSSHPLSSKEEDVNTPSEISELFDAIAYSKGASVIRMLSNFLTEPLFANGLNMYLNEFAYGNTIYDDLWTQLQKAVDAQTAVSLPKTVKQIMDTWTLQMGFPVVTINTSTGKVTQKHFLLDPTSTVSQRSEFNYTWIVPITSMTSSGELPTYWLEEVEGSHTPFKTSSWLLANIDVYGYYRVNYDEENWKRLIQLLESNHKVIPVINRAQIIADAFNLARAKYVSTTLALNTTKYISRETEYLPWQSFLDNLAHFKLMFDRSEVYGPMKQYILKQVTPLFYYFKDLTGNWTNIPDGFTAQYNEINALSTACTFGLQECEELASAMFRSWMENPDINQIPPNLRTTVYCAAIAAGGEAEWDFAWERFREATLATEADKLRSGLACSLEPWILQRFLSYTLDSDKIRKQDATSTIGSIASNVVGQSLAWDFIRAQWSYIFEEYGGGSFSFSNLIERVTRRFSTKFELMQLEQFKKDNEHIGFGSGTRALEQALERTATNIKWVEDNKEDVLLWFKSA